MGQLSFQLGAQGLGQEEETKSPQALGLKGFRVLAEVCLPALPPQDSEILPTEREI